MLFGQLEQWLEMWAVLCKLQLQLVELELEHRLSLAFVISVLLNTVSPYPLVKNSFRGMGLVGNLESPVENKSDYEKNWIYLRTDYICR